MKNLETNLNESNVQLYAAKHYYNPTFSDIEEFNEDLKRFKYIKRLINRYLDQENMAERLLLNHIIVLNNVFGADACSTLLLYKIQPEYWPALKSFLIYLNILRNDELKDIIKDEKVVETLRTL